VYSSPYLKDTWKIFDTCGVGNLHGYPSLVGALLSIGFVTMDAGAEFLQYGGSSSAQILAQLGGIASTLLISIISGYGTGLLIAPLKDASTLSFKDSVWWHLEY
jgi:ammonia channel protein AmtB